MCLKGVKSLLRVWKGVKSLVRVGKELLAEEKQKEQNKFIWYKL